MASEASCPNLDSLLRRIEPRPELFIGSRDIRALSHFLNGYIWAAKEEHPNFDDWIHTDFQSWLARKYNDIRTLNWCGLIRLHEPDGDSTDAFFRLLCEFRAK